MKTRLCKCGNSVRKGNSVMKYKINGIVKRVYKYPHYQCSKCMNKTRGERKKLADTIP